MPQKYEELALVALTQGRQAREIRLHATGSALSSSRRHLFCVFARTTLFVVASLISSLAPCATGAILCAVDPRPENVFPRPENVFPQELAEEHEGELRAQEALKKSSSPGPAQV